jgi:hypothetical protein
MNKQIRDAISRFGEEACIMAYEFNVKQGEGGAFIESNTGIPKRSQGAAIAAGEYLSKRGKMNPRSSSEEISKSERIENLIQWSKSRAGSKTNSDFIENLLFLRSSGLGTPSGMDDINDAIKLLLKKAVDRTNPVHSRNPKQRIGISLSKNRRRNPLESGATISDDDDINDQASNMG